MAKSFPTSRMCNSICLLLAVALLWLGPGLTPLRAQTGSTGAVSVIVTDPTGASVPGAQLQLKDLATNAMRNAETQENGSYTFPNLPFGTYQLTVSKGGFETKLFESVVVQTARLTSLELALKLSTTSETITVSTTETPLVETDASTIANTLDTKQVVNLPVNGRNIFVFALTIPGWASTGANSTTGTWNNMPGGAIQSVDYDGTPANANRFRSSGFGYGYSAVAPRIENIAEMTVSTAQLDLSGTGSAAMRINMVTQRGTNSFHGRVFEDFRNTVLNANSWYNNNHGLPVAIVKLNDFGGSVGGPIWKNKLFFFGTYAQSIQPGAVAGSASVLSAGAQQGIYAYKDTSGALQQVNVMTIGGSGGGPSAVHPFIANELQMINGVLGNGSLTATSDPNISTLSFQLPTRTTIWYPALKFDYYLKESVRISANYSQTKSHGFHVYAPNYPGGIDPLDYTSNDNNAKNAGFGVDWTVRPTVINQFHAGYLYQYSIFDPENLGVDLTKITQSYFNYGTSLYGGNYLRQPISSLYPLFTFNDSLNWQRGNHAFILGGGWMMEHDHYWNGPSGYPAITFGLSANDPMVTNFVNGLKGLTTTQQGQAENLYAELVGRISGVTINSGGRPLDPQTKQYKPFGAYNLNEVMPSGHLFAQDRWRITPNLTLNWGLRWDVVGDDHNPDGGYTSIKSLSDFWGPTPVGAIFQPGNLGGVADPQYTAKVHAYNTSWMNPQPAVALAWAPQSHGFLAKIFPKGRTVIRTGWSLRNYQEGAQNFWAWGSNQGLFFFQQASLTADTSGAVGTYQPGALYYGNTLPAYKLTPPVWSPTVPASALSFGQQAFFGMNPDIRIPYVEQWNFGIQREIFNGTALEVRYAGNMSQHSWMSHNLNEINVFENGFLQEFKNAQNNLAINTANGKSGFANNGLAGQVPLPIFTTALGSATSSLFTNGTYITNLNTGAAGSLAQTMARNQTYFCNMVGTKFSPCAASGFTNAGTYPINFWQVNPFATGYSLNYLDSAGHSNYHALQVELRQHLNHGMQFDLNYTLGKSMVLGPVNAYQANAGAAAGGMAPLYMTERNYRLNYTPSGFDIRHIFHASGTYDLPFGNHRKWLNNSKVTNYVAGGWTLGTIIVLQSGSPTQVGGGYLTVNQNDAGVAFGSLTPQQLQDSVGVYKTGNPWVSTVNPSLIAGNGAVTQSMMAPATTAGVWGYRPFIYGPHWFNADLSANKTIPIRESIRFTFQAQFLNVFNHPTFNLGALSPQALNFAQSTSGPSTYRRIEFRANVEF